MLLFFHDTATTEIYTLSLHDALPIYLGLKMRPSEYWRRQCKATFQFDPIGTKLIDDIGVETRSEEHTSELQSRGHLVCRLLLEKKNRRATDREEAAYQWRPASAAAGS